MVIYSVRGGFALSRAYRFPSQNGKRVVELKQTIQVIHIPTHIHTHTQPHHCPCLTPVFDGDDDSDRTARERLHEWDRYFGVCIACKLINHRAHN